MARKRSSTRQERSLFDGLSSPAEEVEPAPKKPKKALGKAREKKSREAAPPRRSRTVPGGTRANAEDLAKRQREISVSEFFTKNRHLLGFDNPRKALLTAVKEGVDNALDACEEAGIPLMHFSTDFVFAGDKGSPYTIADEPAPLGAYARSKLLGERMVAGLCRRHFVVRLSWVFGDSGEVNFPRKVLGWAKDREVIRVVDDQVSRPAYTPDLVPPLWKLLKSGAFGLYHLANEGICSRFEWASHLVRSAGLGTTVQPARTADFSEAARRPVSPCRSVPAAGPSASPW